MKIVALIPARLEASRFPKKLIQDLNGKPVIYRTVENVLKMGVFDEIAVVADDLIFKDVLKSLRVNVFLSKEQFECGSDRIASVAQFYKDADILINVQGDEPFITKKSIMQLIDAFEDNTVSVASLMHELNYNEVDNPNFVKVVIDKKSDALLFSRSVIPFHRNKNFIFNYYRHIGVYAFKPSALQAFSQWDLGILEAAEQIEALRFLENGMKIRMSLINELTLGIDTPNDLELAKKYFSNL